ncbi:MAG TPA: LysR substrate-binding domain-containing protein [Burkholderiales bacterium]|nr:LysR substrate-binding domain-containing protein [Burkholderiales bacterium]
MDKLRAIQYFNRAADGGSFAAAARFFDVSTSAITQLVGALERSLGVTLFHRTTQGIALTLDGERYYETARRVAADLHDIEQRLGPRGAKPRGTLTVGMSSSLGQYCVMPRIMRFLSRYPDIELVFKPIVTIREIEEKNLDVAVLVGWPPERDLVVRTLAQTQLMVCASPQYWVREGMPHEPEGLRDHHCLILRSSGGTLLDRWAFEKNGERRTIDVKTRLFSDDRTWLAEAACVGAGVIRMIDFTLIQYLSSGLLVPVLMDWKALESPMIFAAYAPSQRRSKLVRVFLDFLVEIFAEIGSERMPSPGSAMPRVPKPDWFGRTHGRHSAYVARGRKSVA